MVAADHVRTLVHDELCEFGCARVHHHRGRPLPEILARDVQEGAGRVVHGTCDQAGERQRHVVRGRYVVAELGVFRALHCFAGHDVGIRALKSVGDVCPVEVEHEPVVCGAFRHAAVPVDDLAVVAVHEVDLHAGDAPLRVERESFAERVVACRVRRIEPQPEPHAALLRVGYERRNVHLRSRFRYIRLWDVELAVPLPVDEHVGPPFGGGKVDVLLRGGHVHLDFAAPPVVPGGKAWPDPRRILYRAWRAEGAQHLGFDEASGVVRHHHHTPGGVEALVEAGLHAGVAFGWRCA